MDAQVMEIETPEDQTNVATVMHQPPANNVKTPMHMIEQAVTGGMGVEVIEKLMALQERWEANEGRKAFDQAIAEVRKDERFKPVHKNAKGHNSKRYANFEAYARMLDPIIAEHGVSYRFETEQANGTISVTCVVAHEAGHSTRNTLAAAADTSGNKNAIQGVGSTLTYLQRYTLIQAFGLAASDDDDGNSAEQSATITQDQADDLRALAEEKGTSIAKVCQFFGIDAFVDLPAKKLADAEAMLKQSKGAN